MAVEIEDAVVDEDGQCVAVGEIGVDVDLIVVRHGADAVIPSVAWFLLGNLLEDAVGGVVVAAVLGDEEAGERAVPMPDFGQVAGHLGHRPLAAQNPVANEGVVGHRR